MAFSRALAASTFAILVSLAFGAPVAPQEELLKNSIIRRHGQEKTVGMTDKAHLYDVNMGHGEQHQKKMAEHLLDLHQLKLGDPLYCNRNFSFAADTAPNTCVDSESIGSDVRCQEAALRLGYTWNGTADNNWVAGAALQMPKNCSVSNGFVHWNPTQPEPAKYESSGGRQICMRLNYLEGEVSTTGTITCPNGDYEAIDGSAGDAHEKVCHDAADCVEGLEPTGCRMPEFGDDSTVVVNNRPKGCFREPAHEANEGETLTLGNGISITSTYGRTGSRRGCFNYNSQASVTGKPNPVTGNPVCRLTAAAIQTWETDKTHMMTN